MAAPGHKVHANQQFQVVYDNGTYQPKAGQTDCEPVTTGYVVPDDGLPHATQIACVGATTPNPAKTACVPGPTPTFNTTIPGVEHLDRIAETDAMAGDQLGRAMAVNGDVMVLGAPHADAGYAIVYTRADGVWTRRAKLTASDAVPNAQFGACIALTDDWVAIEADSAYRLYLFRIPADPTTMTDMTETQLLAGYEAIMPGGTCAINGDVLVAGAYDNEFGADAGSALVFEFDVPAHPAQWSLTTKLSAPWAVPGDRQYSVALDGDTAVVGSALASVAGRTGAGRASVWVRAADRTWAHQGDLMPADLVDNVYFGHGVAISGDTVAISAAAHDLGANAGAVYIFTRAATPAEWTQQAKLTAFDGAAGARWGYPRALALSGNTLVVGTSASTPWQAQCTSFTALGRPGPTSPASPGRTGRTPSLAPRWRSTGRPSSPPPLTPQLMSVGAWPVRRAPCTPMWVTHRCQSVGGSILSQV